ncbi:GmrSD restriction endonuclease domain-containing protein [Halocola ammonii]
MEATQAQLLNLLDGKKQFTIPIYQRTYSWHKKQCDQLFKDIVRVGNDASEPSHFIGSIVYFKPGNSPITSVPELLVIDGQQRLTTVSLLLLALTHFLKEQEHVSLEDETWEEVQETYLVNKHRKDDSKYKLLLTKKDKLTFTNLIDEIEVSEAHSKRIVENYEFFKGVIHADNIQSVYHGIKKLIIVDVILERDKDNPQLIFESLNSTGVDLSQADLIRNYILMGQPSDVQTELYEKYWYPMEQSFGENISLLAWYIRDYLTMREGSIPKIGLVYERYKQYLNSSNGPSIEEAIKSLFKFSRYYVRIALLKEKDPGIEVKLREISKLKIDTSYPFLLAVYSDYEDGQISKDEFIEIIDLVSNYVFRRAICGIPTNSLNKTFATLYKRIKRKAYLESVKAAFLLMDGYRRFPSDAEFVKELQVKDVYNFRSRNYLLESLENWNRKELVNAENYTIEHILPQNESLSFEWKNELGENWQQIRDKYLHTLGNLSLTRYNSELSDRPFSEKKAISGGFDSSPLFLNESVRETKRWDETAILDRVSKLADRACTVWRRPSLPENRLELYRQPGEAKELEIYSLDHYDYLRGEILDLYKALEKRILNIDSSVRVEFKKLYIAFKSQTNFVDVVPQKKRLRLSLNSEFDQIKDPKGMCIDVSGLGRWGNGDVEVGLANMNEVDYIMELIEQAFEGQIDSV